MRKVLVALVLLASASGAAWWWAGHATGPAIQIRQPSGVVGQSTPLEVALDAAGGAMGRVDVTVEQNGKRIPVIAVDTAPAVVVSRIGKREQPDLQAGPARVVVTASRPVLFGLRQVRSDAAKDIQVRLEPPRVEVLSTLHYINQGGAEFVVYRATPQDVTSGVRVGDQIYQSYPGTSVGVTDPAVRVAFVAMLHDQDPAAPVTVFASDGAGTEAVASVEHRVFPKPFTRSRIELPDAFLQRVVPAIAAAMPDMNLSTAPPDLLPSFLRINGELRKRNNATLVELSRKTAAQMLWTEAFQPLGNAKVEAGFADARTYVYQGRDVDHQTHLGFDLAVTQHIPVVAANKGVVALAGDLGIYGNCIVVDHGLGVQSLYGHLSVIDVKAGAQVDKGQVMGRSGTTGLAAGDHLHFTMLVDGRPVNPVEWWDPKWMQDRVLRKIEAAGGRH